MESVLSHSCSGHLTIQLILLAPPPPLPKGGGRGIHPRPIRQTVPVRNNEIKQDTVQTFI